MNYFYKKYDSPIGKLCLIANEDSLCGVIFDKTWSSFKKNYPSLQKKETKILKATEKQLREYFEGKRKKFTLPYMLNGTAFQKKVWSALASIPYGKTCSYKEQGKLIRAPRAVRAIGRTNGLNPICIVLPCHRVIGSNGSLTGYGGGLKAKSFLLKLEVAKNSLKA